VAATIVTATTAATAAAPAASAVGVVQAAPSSQVLDYQFQWQETGYWCGPAATRNALTARGYYNSQSDLAGRLGTTVDGTSSSSEITRVLNEVGQTSFYETKVIPGQSATSDEIARLKSDVLYDIPRGFPLVANIVGQAVDTDGDSHSYWGGHYLAVVGYSDDGNTVKIADSADANGYGWYWMSTARLADWIAMRGYSA